MWLPQPTVYEFMNLIVEFEHNLLDSGTDLQITKQNWFL